MLSASGILVFYVTDKDFMDEQNHQEVDVQVFLFVLKEILYFKTK